MSRKIRAALAATFILGALSGGALAATFTLTLTNAQVTAIQRAFTAYNADHPSSTYATAQDYGAALFNTCVDQVVVGLNARQREAWKTACRAGNQSAQDAACTAVGLSSGCNPCPAQ